MRAAVKVNLKASNFSAVCLSTAVRLISGQNLINNIECPALPECLSSLYRKRYVERLHTQFAAVPLYFKMHKYKLLLAILILQPFGLSKSAHPLGNAILTDNRPLSFQPLHQSPFIMTDHIMTEEERKNQLEEKDSERGERQREKGEQREEKNREREERNRERERHRDEKQRERDEKNREKERQREEKDRERDEKNKEKDRQREEKDRERSRRNEERDRNREEKDRQREARDRERDEDRDHDRDDDREDRDRDNRL